MAEQTISRLADVLRAARETAVPVPRSALAEIVDLDTAYGVQAHNVRRRLKARGVRSGRKVGLTAEAVRRQLGVEQPMYGVLFADMDVSDQAPISTRALIQPRIEAEIALVLGRDVPPGLTLAALRAHVDHARVAAEIVDTAVQNWEVGLHEVVADNGAAALYALGAPSISLDVFEPADAIMRMTRNGVICSEGRGVDCMGDPLLALAWLADATARRGDGLKAGEVILAGALGPISPVTPGDSFDIQIDRLPGLSVSFEVRT